MSAGFTPSLTFDPTSHALTATATYTFPDGTVATSPTSIAVEGWQFDLYVQLIQDIRAKALSGGSTPNAEDVADVLLGFNLPLTWTGPAAPDPAPQTGAAVSL